jgi:hypothetical protein
VTPARAQGRRANVSPVPYTYTHILRLSFSLSLAHTPSLFLTLSRTYPVSLSLSRPRSHPPPTSHALSGGCRGRRGAGPAPPPAASPRAPPATPSPAAARRRLQPRANRRSRATKSEESRLQPSAPPRSPRRAPGPRGRRRTWRSVAKSDACGSCAARWGALSVRCWSASATRCSSDPSPHICRAAPRARRHPAPVAAPAPQAGAGPRAGRPYVWDFLAGARRERLGGRQPLWRRGRRAVGLEALEAGAAVENHALDARTVPRRRARAALVVVLHHGRERRCLPLAAGGARRAGARAVRHRERLGVRPLLPAGRRARRRGADRGVALHCVADIRGGRVHMLFLDLPGSGAVRVSDARKEGRAQRHCWRRNAP